jgi:tetratricopeptide (TPR) repeat protein
MDDDKRKDFSNVKGDFIEELNEDFDSFETWIMENWRFIVAGCVLAVLIVAGIGVGLYVSRSLDAKTARAFADADTQERLVAVIKAHPGAPAASEARMKLATMLMAKKDYAGAIAIYKEIVASGKGGDALGYRAALNEAYALELLGKKDEAVDAFSSVAQKLAAPDEVRAEANYGAGRLLAAKDPVKAKDFLSKANTANPSSLSQGFWSSQAKALMDRLGAEAVPAAPAKAPAQKAKG